MCKNIKNWDWITILYFVFIIVSILAINCIVCNIKSLSNTSTVLAFIGILATFVVVSNYAQMLEFRNSTKNDLNKTTEKINEQSKTIEKLKNKYEETVSSNAIIKDRLDNLKNPSDIMHKELSDIIRIKIVEAMQGVNGKFGFNVDDVLNYKYINNGVYFVEAKVIKSDTAKSFYVDIIKKIYSPADQKHNE